MAVWAARADSADLARELHSRVRGWARAARRMAAKDDDCDACEELKRISREAGGLQWGAKGRSTGARKPPAATVPAAAAPAAAGTKPQPQTSDAHAPSADGAGDGFYAGGFWERQPPPGLAELGQAGWTLLHTMAAYYPDEADDAKQAVTHQFLRSFAKVFPCTDCARDFQRIMTERPPHLRTRSGFVQWMCEAHNDVNAQLGKPAFPCPDALARWRSPKAPHHDK